MGIVRHPSSLAVAAGWLLLLGVAVLSLPTIVYAQGDVAVSLECPGETNNSNRSCLACIAQGCGWFPSGGNSQCWQSCSFIADAPCYSRSSNTGTRNQTDAEICAVVEQEKVDNEICSKAVLELSNTNSSSSSSLLPEEACQVCTSTLQSDGTTKCQWFVELQSCSRSGVCNLLGCSTSNCDALSAGDDDDAPPSFDNAAFCAGTNSNTTTTTCQTCLDRNCAWTLTSGDGVGGGCGEVCDFTSAAAAPCVTLNTLANVSPAEICATLDQSNSNSDTNTTSNSTNVCVSLDSCEACSSTVPCQWYPLKPLLLLGNGSFSGNDGACCDDSRGNCSELLTGGGAIRLQPALSCDSLDQQFAVCHNNGSSSCGDCLAAECGWVPRSFCLPSCDIIADVACYSSQDTSASNNNNNTNEDICARAAVEVSDQELCSSASSNAGCRNCTSVVLSDGISTCRWFPSSGTFAGTCCTGDFCDFPGLGGTFTCEDDENNETPPIPSCDMISTCSECLDSTCAWAAGSCIQSCIDIADAACYTIRPTPVNSTTSASTSQQICAIADAEDTDTDLCIKQLDCSTCTATVLSSNASEKCEWYEMKADGSDMSSIAYCGTGKSCDMNGVCGSSTCSNATTTCANSTECTSCLADGCAWVANTCEESCSDVADVVCYTASFFANSTIVDVCQEAQVVALNEALCLNQTNCSSCTNAVQSDGSSLCQWYTSKDGEAGISYCGTGAGCDSNGICGSSTCQVDDEPVSNRVCKDSTTCTNCLDIACAWSGGKCLNSCSVFSGSFCYSIKSYPNQNSSSICRKDKNHRFDESLCQNQTDCGSCTTTIKTDGINKCQWYKDTTDNNTGSNASFCGIGGCSITGECGTSQCSNGSARPVSASTLEETSGTLSSRPTNMPLGLDILALLTSWLACVVSAA